MSGIASMKLRTYTKPKAESKSKKKKLKTTSNRFEPIPEILQEDVFDANDSMRSDIWQDSFDKFVGRRTPLRKANLITKNVRAEYNANSSVEVTDDSFIAPVPVSSDNNMDKRRLKDATISTPLRLTPESDLFSMISPIAAGSSQSGPSNIRDVDSQSVGLNSQTDENQISELIDDFHLVSTSDTVRTGSARGYNRGYNSSNNNTSTQIFAGQNKEIQNAQVRESPGRGRKRKPERGKNRVQTRRGQPRKLDKDLELLAGKVVEHVNTKYDDMPLPNAEEIVECTGSHCNGSLNIPALLELEEPKYSIRKKWKEKIQEHTNDTRPKCKNYLRIEVETPSEGEEPPVCYDEKYLQKTTEFFQEVNKSNNQKKKQQKSKTKPSRTENQNVNTSEKSLPTFLIEDSDHDHEIGMSTPLNAHRGILSVTPPPLPSMDITTDLELDYESKKDINRNMEHLNSLVRETASGLHSNMGRKGIIVGATFDTSSSLNSGSYLSQNRSKNSETLVNQTNSTNAIDQCTSTLTLPRLDSMFSLPGSLRRVDRSTPQNSLLGSMNLSRGFRHISSDITPLNNSCLLEMNHIPNKTPNSTPVCEAVESVYQNQSNELDSISNQRDNSRNLDTTEYHVSTFRHTNDSLQFESSSAMTEKPSKQVKSGRKKKNLNVVSRTLRYNLRNRKNRLEITSTPSGAMSDLRDSKYPSTDTDITEVNVDESEQRVEVRNNPLESPKDSKVSLRPVRYNLRRRNISLEVNPTPTVSELPSARISSTDTEIFDPTEFGNERRKEIQNSTGENLTSDQNNIRLKRLQLNLKSVTSIPSEDVEMVTLQSIDNSIQNLSDCDMESVSSKTSIFEQSEETCYESVNDDQVHSRTVTSIPCVQRISDNQEVAKCDTENIPEETAQACGMNPGHVEVNVVVQNVAPPDAAGSESDEPDPMAIPVPRERRSFENSIQNTSERDVERMSSNAASGMNPGHVEVVVSIQNVTPESDSDGTDQANDNELDSAPISLDEMTVPLDMSNRNASFQQVLEDARELSIRCRKEAELALQSQNFLKKRLHLGNIQNSTKTGDSNLDGTIDKECFFSTISERTTNLAVTQSSLGGSNVWRSISGHNLLPHNASKSPGISRTSRKSCLNESNSSNLPLIELKGGKWRRKLSSIRKSRDSSSRHSKQFDSVSRASAGVPSSARKVVIAKQPSKNLELSGLMEASREFSLLIEPTDDETPKLLSSELLDNPYLEKRLQKSLQFIETTTKPTAATRNPVAAEFKRLQIEENISRFNESTGERRRTYQQQLSTPYSINRETSVLHQLSSRRRRTSFIEDTQISGRNPFNQLGLVPTNETSLHAQHHLSTRDVVLRRCGQSEPIDFVSIYSEEDLQNCRKIGEGVYGEVFMNKSHQSGEAVVLKIIPIEGSIEVNGEPQKKFDEILSEIIIAMELSKLRNDREYMTSGFVEVKNVRCVQGRYPEYLIDLWELYRDNYGTENDHPEIFTDDQLFIVLELANGGQDLEAFTFQNAMQSYSAFLQTAITLAVAENKFQFEHRDLHWGNILLKPTDDKFVKYIFKGNEIKVPTHGVKVTIIDYTLSRMIFDTCCLFNDLSNDDELFSAGGDYQFDIYRLMRERLDNNWEVFDPYTNVLWLHYTVDKMISGARYQNTKSKKHRGAMNDIMKLRDELLDFKSASDYIESLY